MGGKCSVFSRRRRGVPTEHSAGTELYSGDAATAGSGVPTEPPAGDVSATSAGRREPIESPADAAQRASDAADAESGTPIEPPDGAVHRPGAVTVSSTGSGLALPPEGPVLASTSASPLKIMPKRKNSDPCTSKSVRPVVPDDVTPQPGLDEHQLDPGESNSTGEIPVTIGQISFKRKDKIGDGCDGTFVFRGKFGKRDVAVKRILLDRSKTVNREEDRLIKLDHHENVIRYLATETDVDFYYIALELALGSVEDYVRGKYTGPEIDNTSLLLQAANGLHFLHKQNILHRDIKPTNILLVQKGRTEMVVTKLADFGHSKDLSGSNQTKTMSAMGTQVWRVPEDVLVRASDVFSFGCVIYYVLSKGEHAFGCPKDLEENIKRGKYGLSAVKDISRKSLVEGMIQQDPVERPSAEYVAKHPIFWQLETTMKFIQAVSDRIMDDKDSELGEGVNKLSCLVLGGTEDKPDNWKNKIEDDLISGGRANYRNADRLADMIRLIRNKLHHFSEMSEETRSVVGETKKEFMAYMMAKFPDYVLYVWLAASVRSQQLTDFYPSDLQLSLVNKLLMFGFNLDKTEIMPNNRTMMMQPPKRTGLPLYLIAHRYGNLKSADLRRFSIDRSSLRTLARLNRQHLSDVTLPAGCSGKELRTLCVYTSLKSLTVESPPGTGRWLEKLSHTLEELHISGMGAPLEQWPQAGLPCLRQLTLSGCSGVTNDTLASLPGLAPGLNRLTIENCPQVTAGGLVHLGRLTKLEDLTLNVVLAGVVSDAGDSENSGRWLQNLPQSLVSINISGMGASLEPRPQASLPSLRRLNLSGCSGVTDDTLASLPGLAPGLYSLTIENCPQVTAVGLVHLGRLTKLEDLTLKGVLAGVVSDAGDSENSGRWLQKLPQSLEILNISGMEAPLKPRPQAGQLRLRQLTLSGCSGVTNDTLACLPELAPDLTHLTIDDCSRVTAGGLVHLGRLTKLEYLTLKGVLAGDVTDAGQTSPEDSRRWLQKLPQSLERIIISGMEAPLEQWPQAGLPRLRWLLLSGCSGVTDGTLDSLLELAPGLISLTIENCRRVTAGCLVHLGRLTELRSLHLTGGRAGVVTDTELDSLLSCPGLISLTLGDRQQPQEIPAAAGFRRLVVACWRLSRLALHTTVASSQAILDALHQADLGFNSWGDPRTIWLRVPGSVYSQLRERSDSRINVEIDDDSDSEE